MLNRAELPAGLWTTGSSDDPRCGPHDGSHAAHSLSSVAHSRDARLKALRGAYIWIRFRLIPEMPRVFALAFHCISDGELSIRTRLETSRRDDRDRGACPRAEAAADAPPSPAAARQRAVFGGSRREPGAHHQVSQEASASRPSWSRRSRCIRKAHRKLPSR